MYPHMLPVGGQNVRGPAQKRGFQTREDLLDAALTVFHREPPADVTIRLIAAEAERSVGALYQYFHDKEDMLDFLAARHLEHLRIALLTIVEAEGVATTAAQLAGQLVDGFITGCRRDPRLARVIAEHAPQLPQVLDHDERLAGAAAPFVGTDRSTTVTPTRAARLIVVTTAHLVRSAGGGDDLLREDLVAMFRGYLSGGEHPCHELRR